MNRSTPAKFSIQVLIVALLLGAFATGCSQTHNDGSEQIGQDFQRIDPDAGAPTDDNPASEESPATAGRAPSCPVQALDLGIAKLEIFSESLGGELPVTFSAHCDQEDGALRVMASDGLSTFRLSLQEPALGDLTGEGSFEFEDLATFTGHCNVCMNHQEGSLSCPSLVWQTGDDLVKASVSGSFRCEANE